MNDSQIKVQQALKTAILSEMDGYHFYKMAAGNTDDEKARDVFGRLAQEERHHAAFLKKQYKTIMDTGSPDADLKLEKPTDFSGPGPIFSDAIRERIGTAHMEMSALSIGLQLELDSESFYRKEAQESDNEVISSFFGELADWEAGHYRALKQQMDELKEDYWNNGAFSPF